MAHIPPFVYGARERYHAKTAFLAAYLTVLPVVSVLAAPSPEEYAAATKQTSFVLQTDASGNNMILNSILGTFQHFAALGFQNLKPEALWLLGVFAIINICTTWTLYDGEMRMSQLIGQIIKIGAFFFLILHMGAINNAIMNSFQHGGLIAALGVSGADGVGITPSQIVDIGMSITSDLWAHFDFSIYQLGDLVKFVIILALVIFSFFVMGLQILITKIEFNIFAAIAVILMPFGALRFTSFLFQRAVSCVFSFGIKLMICYFMMGIVMDQANDFKALPNITDVTFGGLLTQSLGYVAIAYLVWKVPAIVAGMMNGQPALDGNGISKAAGGFMAGAAWKTLSPVSWYHGLSAAMGARGYMKATSQQAKKNMVSSFAAGKYGYHDTAGGGQRRNRPGTADYVGAVTHQLARQAFSHSRLGRSMMHGGQKAQNAGEDFGMLHSGNYTRNKQSNRN